MKLSQLISKLEILSLNADTEMEITGICYDSRKAAPGYAFVAISGFETDGHRFINAAVEKGAALVFCEKIPESDIPYIQVKNCRYALAMISIAWFGNPADKMKIIGITGTNGKTTSSYLIKHIIEKVTGDKVGLIGTNGNMIGDVFIHTERTTPESYELHELFSEMLVQGCKYVVMEVSSHSLKLDRVAGITFKAAEFTNLTQDHLDFHHTIDDYAASKKLLFSRCINACISADDEWSQFMLDDISCKALTFSSKDHNCDIFASDIEYSSTGVRFILHYMGCIYEAFLGIPGHFSVMNAIGVLTVGVSLGFDVLDCIAALKTAKGVKGRAEIVPTDRDYTIVIDYAHTPDALVNIMTTLKPLTRRRLIVLFGCGGDRDREKRPLMGAAVSEYADVCVVTSDNPRTEEPQAIIDDILEGVDTACRHTVVICDRIDAIHWTIDNALPGDVILLAGKGHEDYQVVGHEKHHMDEREIVADYLKEKRI